MNYAKSDALVLAVYPSSRGFGYVLFEGPLSPYDWGVKEVRGRNKTGKTLRLIESLIENYGPVILVIEDAIDEACRRVERIHELYRKLIQLAPDRSVTVVRYSMQKVKQYFAHASAFTKHDIAVAIAKIIPAFSYQLPPERKLWMSEDVRQSLYDAAALGLTYYHLSALTDPRRRPGSY